MTVGFLSISLPSSSMSAQLYFVWGIVLKYNTKQSIIPRQWSHLVWLSHQLNCASKLEVYLQALECSMSVLMKYTEINLCHEHQWAIVPTCDFTSTLKSRSSFTQWTIAINEIHIIQQAIYFNVVHNIELILISILILAWCPTYASWKKLSFPWRPICA